MGSDNFGHTARSSPSACASDWRWHVENDYEPPGYLLYHRQNDAQHQFLTWVNGLDGACGFATPEEIAKACAAECINPATSNHEFPRAYSVEGIQYAHHLVDKSSGHCGAHPPSGAGRCGAHPPTGVEIELLTFIVDPNHFEQTPEQGEVMAPHVLPDKCVYDIEREPLVLTKRGIKEIC